MSTRTAVAALAAFVTALSFQGTASARNSAHASNQAVQRLQTSNAFGSINNPASASIGRPSSAVFSGGTAVGRDPDANVRLELLRDKDIGKY
jgi:hypothetical protein